MHNLFQFFFLDLKKLRKKYDLNNTARKKKKIPWESSLWSRLTSKQYHNATRRLRVTESSVWSAFKELSWRRWAISRRVSCLLSGRWQARQKMMSPRVCRISKYKSVTCKKFTSENYWEINKKYFCLKKHPTSPEWCHDKQTIINDVLSIIHGSHLLSRFLWYLFFF